MRLAFVGTGFVADYYQATLANHPELSLAGIYDRDAVRAEAHARYYGARRYGSLEELLDDRSVELVLNLTNPRSHYAVSRACLEAGKHVYSEKPLAMAYEEAETLVTLAESKGLRIASAPCNVLGEAAQTAWKAIRDGQVGPVRAVYAEMDDGMIHRMRYRHWKSASGAPWPWKDELEVGCTLEHAGYYVTWLVAFFGPATRVTAFATTAVPDKKTDLPLDTRSPDFTVACIEFASGVVARLTCSIVATHDHALIVHGEDGVLRVAECWDYGSPITLKRRNILYRMPRPYPLVKKADFRHCYEGSHRMDFSRGPAELAASVRERRPCRLSERFCLHVNEIVLAIQSPPAGGSVTEMRSSFEPVEPMPWATGESTGPLRRLLERL